MSYRERGCGSEIVVYVVALGALSAATCWALNEIVQFNHKLVERLTDPVGTLACGTSKGPFEVEGKIEIDRYKYLGGRKVLKVRNEFRLEHLDKGFNYDLLEYGADYKWANNGHEVEIEITGNDGKKLELEYVASCATPGSDFDK